MNDGFFGVGIRTTINEKGKLVYKMAWMNRDIPGDIILTKMKHLRRFQDEQMFDKFKKKHS